MRQTIYGKPASEGAVRGTLHLIRHAKEGAAPMKESSAVWDGASEEARYAQAVDTVEAELAEIEQLAEKTVGTGDAAIFEIHRLMLRDDDFTDKVKQFIHADSLPADEAVLKAGEELAAVFTQMDSEYMQARAADIRSVARRVCTCLRGEREVSYELAKPCILATDDLTPAETICLDKTKVLGIVTEQGSDSSHTAILARSMGIPAVVGTGEISAEWDGRDVILDGSEGVLYLDPDEAAESRFEHLSREQEAKKAKVEVMRGVTLRREDGRPIRICANAAELSDIDTAMACDAEGIGLFRSEFLFMRYGRSPTEEEQFEVYRSAAERAKGKECVIRTLDAGADKRIPYLNDHEEHNPALGMRAVRISLKKPELLYTQLRALYRAAAYGAISAMIPMVVLPDEMAQVRKAAEMARDSLRQEGIPYGEMRLGMMIETPSAALCADLFAGMADFFSIGTNDLIQYTMAADRENRDVAYLSDPLPESVKRLIRMTAEAAGAAGIPVGVCGELAADERYIGFLLDCGVSSLSVTPPKILSVRYAASHVKISV